MVETEERQPARRRRRRKVAVWGPPVVLALLGLLLILPFLLVRFSPVRQWILDRSVRALLAPGGAFEIGNVERLDPSGFDFREVRVGVDDASAPWLQVGRMHASWSFWDLVGQRVHVDRLRVEGVTIDLDAVPARIFAARRRTDSGLRGIGRPRIPPLRCEQLEVEDVTVRRGGDAWLRAVLRLRDIEHEQGNVFLRFEEGTVRVPRDSLELSLADGSIRGRLIEEVTIDSMRVRATGLQAALAAQATAAPAGSTGVRIDGVLDVDGLEPMAVPPLRRIDLPWAPEDRLAGTIVFSGDLHAGRAPRTDLILGLTGQVLGTAVDTLHILAAASPDRTELIDLQLRSGRLELEGEGEWEPELGTASGRARFRDLDLSAPPVARFTSGLPRSVLSGGVEAAAVSLGDGATLEVDLRLDHGTLLDRPLEGFHAAGVVSPREVRLDTLWTRTPGPASLSARGRVDRTSERMDVRGRFRGFALESWLEPWVQEGLGGAVSGPFQLSGSLRRPELIADLSVRDGRVVEVHVDSLHAGNARGTLRPLAIEASVRAWTGDFYDIGADSLRASVFIADTIRVAARAFRDTTRISVWGGVVPVSEGSVFFDSLRVEPGSAPMVELAEPATLFFRPDLVWVDSLRVRSAAGTAWGTGRIRAGVEGEKNQPFSFAVEGRGLDLGAIADYFGLPSDSLNGTADVEFSGSGTLYAPAYRFAAEARTAEVYGWLWERVAIAGRAGAIGAHAGAPNGPSNVYVRPQALSLLAEPARGTGGVFQIDSLNAVAHGYAGPLPVLGPERFGPEPPGSPVRVELRDLQIQSPREWARWVGAVESDSIFATLEESRITGTLRIEDLPVGPILAPILVPRSHQGSSATFAEPLDPMLSVIRVEREVTEEVEIRPSRVGGRISLTAEVGGSGAMPSVHVTGRAKDLQIYQAFADSLELEITYADSVFYVPEILWMRDDRGVRVSGRVPAVVAADPRRVGLLEEPLWLEAEIPSVDLALASLATTLIEEPRGDLSGRARLKGTPPHVYLEGDLRVQDGAFRIPNREERVTDVRAELRLDSLGVHIESARGRWMGEGTVEGSGRYRNETDFLLRARVDDALIYESGSYRFVVDGVLEASPVAAGDTLRPELRGTVQVQEGVITMDLTKPGREKVLVTPWLIQLEVEAPANVRVVQPVSDVELAGGQLDVRYDMPFWNLSGDVDVRRGTYRVFNTRFDIVSGTVEFLDTGTGPFPVFDVTARTEIADPETGLPLEIMIEVDGSPVPGEQLDIVLSSPDRPDYTSADLTRLLSVGQLTSGELATGSSADPAREYLTGEVLNRLERELLGDVGILNRVDVSGGTAADDPFTVSVRAITYPDWSVRYSTEITDNPGQEVSLNYRLSNLFFLDAAVDRRPTDLGVTAETYSLDLKVRVEF